MIQSQEIKKILNLDDIISKRNQFFHKNKEKSKLVDTRISLRKNLRNEIFTKKRIIQLKSLIISEKGISTETGKIEVIMNSHTEK